MNTIKLKAHEILAEIPKEHEYVFYGTRLIANKIDGSGKPIEFDFIDKIWREIEYKDEDLK